MGSVRKSLLLSALDSYLGLLLQIASTVIIARILTPEEVGIFAVAAVFAALASTFRDFGVAEYLIQERELSSDAIRAAFTVNIVVSWGMAALLFGLSPVIADFYRINGVGEVMRVQALTFVLIPFGAVTMAWFRRQMNFRPILVSGLLANITSFFVVVGLAFSGFSYMSMAWAALAGVVVTVTTALLMRPIDFPRWPGLRGVRRVIDFGKFASGIYIFGQLGKGAPEMVIGRALDMSAVGIFSRASGLVEIFNRLVLRSVLPICLPYFAQSVREQGSPLQGLLRTMSYLTAVGWVFLGFMAVAAFAVIRVMYGTQWLEAIALAQLLCFAGAIELLYYPAKEALLSLGKAKECNTLQILTQSLRIVGVLCVIPFGLAGAAWGLVGAAMAGALLAHAALRRHVGLRPTHVLKAVGPSLRLTMLAIGPLAACSTLWPINEQNYVRYVVLGASATTLLWLLGLRWLRHPLWIEVQRVLQIVRGRLQSALRAWP